MRRTWIVLGIVVIGLAELGHWSRPAAEQTVGDTVTVPVETVADYIHSVIEAHRTFYTIQVVERMQKKGKLVAAENWRTTHTLPLPVQLLKEADELGALTGSKIRYRLIGLWPINKHNAPATDVEKKGLEEIQKRPEQRHGGIVSMGDGRYFQAIYADRAVTQACIGCHNAHPRSPKKDFRLDDVMGGLVIEIPLEK
ncbi:MAG: Tll0287-like domain-containing protein [Nitrospiraceae bacterium]